MEPHIEFSNDELRQSARLAIDEVLVLAKASGVSTSRTQISDIASGGTGISKRASRGTRVYGPGAAEELNRFLLDETHHVRVQAIFEQHDAKVRVSRLRELSRLQKAVRRKSFQDAAWRKWASDLQTAYGFSPRLSNVETVRSYTDILVLKPRKLRGEAAALRNAYILMRGYLTAFQPRDSGQRLAMLDLMGCVADLAAQLNDVKLLCWIAGRLSDTVKPSLKGPLENKICDRQIAHTESRIIKYGSGARASSKIKATKRLITNALEIDFSDDEVTTLAKDWGYLSLGWLDPYMSRTTMGIFLGEPKANIDRYLADHDRATARIRFRNVSEKLLGEGIAKMKYADLYAADVLVSLLISQGALNDAIGIASDAIEGCGHHKDADTAYASILLSICSAILKKYGRNRAWNSSQRKEYRIARNNAALKLTELDMSRKLCVLRNEELQNGYIEK